MPPRLVATDLDGTLVGADGRVSLRTGEVLAAVAALGVPVVFVTARPLRWMGDIWPHVGSHSLAIVSNGAILYDVGARSVIDIAGIDPAVGRTLLVDLAEALPRAQCQLEALPEGTLLNTETQPVCFQQYARNGNWLPDSR